MIKDSEAFNCKNRCATQEDLDEIIRQMPDDDALQELAHLFKVFGDYTRVRILSVLFKRELCVYHLVQILGMNQPAVSHQLRVLRAAKLVKYRKEGKNVYYSLDDDHVYKLLADGLAHVLEDQAS